MINKIEHIGIAVADVKKSEDLFEKLLGKKPYKKEEVASEGVVTSFFKIGNQKIELLKGNNSGSPIKKFIEKRLKTESSVNKVIGLNELKKYFSLRDGSKIITLTPLALIRFIMPCTEEAL